MKVRILSALLLMWICYVSPFYASYSDEENQKIETIFFGDLINKLPDELNDAGYFSDDIPNHKNKENFFSSLFISDSSFVESFKDKEKTFSMNVPKLSYQSILSKKVEGEKKAKSLKKFKCDYRGCFKKYTREQALFHHIKSIHKHKTYACQVEGCLFSCSHSGDRKPHVKKMHPEKMVVLYPLVCSSCGERFSKINYLKGHRHKCK